MKHVANRSKSIVKSKAKALTQAKCVVKIKPAAKKSIGKVALKPNKQKLIQKVKTVAKAAPKKPANSKKTTSKNIAPKFSAKTLNALKTISARKTKAVAKQIEKPEAKKNTPQIAVKTIKKSPKTASAKTVKPMNAKAKPATSAKKTTVKKVSKSAPMQKAKLKLTAAKPKNVVKKFVVASVKATKPQSSKTPVRKINKPLPTAKTTVAAAKIKFAPQKTKPIVAAKKPAKIAKKKLISPAKTVKRKKIAPPVAVKTVERKSKKIQTIAPRKKIPAKAVKIKSSIEPKKIVKPADKIAPVVSAKKTGEKMLKMKPAISSAKLDKARRKIKKAIAFANSKPIENRIEEIKLPASKPKPKKAKAISSAIFRGRKDRYDFQVYPLDAIFEDVPAIYVISKRKIDRRKRAHHALVCIGQTDSILGEIKKHKKGKCVKKHEANVISLLPETNETRRLKIETDLKAAHAIPCVHA